MNIERLSNELEQIVNFDLWKLAVEKLRHRRLLNSMTCEQNDDIDEIKFAQGAIFELDLILGKKERPGLLDRIIQEALEGSTKEK